MSKDEFTTIPTTRHVYYDVYANLPVVGVSIGDLGYATDRLVFYRWSGAAWQAVTVHSSSGIAGNRPAAADLPDGSLYHSTDTDVLSMVEAGAWVDMPAGAGITQSDTEVYNAAAPNAWTDLDLSGTVGARVTVVALKIYLDANADYAIRRNGDTDDVSVNNTTNACGVQLAGSDNNGDWITLICSTDASGIIEHIKDDVGNIVIDVMWFFNQ